MAQNKALQMFAEGPVSSAVLKNCLPSIAAMVMVLVYNLADTLFIGQTHNDYMVAAVSLATPVYLIFMALGTIFGMGGTSLISRSLGAGKTEYAKKISAFCMWSCVAVGALCSVFMWLFMDKLVIWLGASRETAGYTKIYLNIVTIGGIFSLISTCYSNVIRAEGRSNTAMAGTIIGNLLNVILDPIMISGLGWGIAGAAIATVIGNAVSALFYIGYFLSGRSCLSIGLKSFSVKDGIPGGVLSVGIPAALGSLLMSVSSIITNALMAQYGDLSVAAYGVASKVIMITSLAAIGIGQGVQPLFGYCYGARNRKRFISALRFSAFFGLGLCAVMTGLCYIFAPWIVSLFLTDKGALSNGVLFARVMMSTGWLFGLFYVLINALQGMGAAMPSLIVSISRQGLIYIPAVFLMKALVGINGLVWAQPAADLSSLILVIFFLARELKKSGSWELRANAETAGGAEAGSRSGVHSYTSGRV